MSANLYYLYLNDQQAGPYTFGQLQAMWNSGAVTAETLFWIEGQANWEKLLAIADLLDTPSAQTLPPRPAPKVQTTNDKIKVYGRPDYLGEAAEYQRKLAELGWEEIQKTSRISNSKKESLLKRIECRQDARSVIKPAARVCIFYGWLFAVLIIMSWSYFVCLTGAVIWCVIGFCLWKYNSRTAAIIGLLLSCCGIAEFFIEIPQRNFATNGIIILLAVFQLFVAIRMTEASFKIHNAFADEENSDSEDTYFASREAAQRWVGWTIILGIIGMYFWVMRFCR